MSSNNNFLLKIHMEEDNSITEIYLNKERRSFTFIDDECISDLIIPEFKITSLNMILENINDNNGSDVYYAEYEKSGETVREYDKEKINILANLITKISVNDFLDYQKDIKINDYYVDNVVDAYNCVLPTEMKKILSYTTNGVVFNGDEIIYFMPHEDIVSYDKKNNNFIPFMIRNGKSHIGFDYKESMYKEYLEMELVKESKSLEEIIGINEIKEESSIENSAKEEIEIIGEEENGQNIKTTEQEQVEDEVEIIGEEENNQDIKTTEQEQVEDEVEIIGEEENNQNINPNEQKEMLENEIEKVDEEYENTIKNIDYQFERLNSGISQKEKKEPYKYIEKESKSPIPSKNGQETENENADEKEKALIKQEIRDGVIKSLEEIEKTNILIDEIDSAIGRVAAKTINLKAKNKPKEEKVVISDEVGKEAEEILQKLNDEIAKLEETKKKTKKKEKIVISDEIGKEAEAILKKLNGEIAKKNEKPKKKETVVISDEIGKEAEAILKKLNGEIAKKNEKPKKKETVVISDEIGKEAEAILKKLNKELTKDEIAKEKQSKVTKAKEEDKKDSISLNELINNSINNALDNYKINFNDTQKLVVEHLPYYEFSNDFNVIQIPEIDIDKLTLLPNSEIDLGKLRLKVEKMYEERVELLVENATSIIDKNGNKVKKGDHIIIDINSEIDLRLNRKSAMETWSLKMEKSTFEKELRNIDFKKIMNYIVQLDSYKKLGNIEKYELQKSVMLFIEFIMENKEESVLEELYRIIEKQPDLYEEYITKYNNKNSLELKDFLGTYEQKKEYLMKLNYINGLIDAKWLDYPRYIFNAHEYFDNDDFLDEFISELDKSLTEKDFYDYLMKLFNEYDMFTELDDDGKENLEKCIDYLSRLYKYRPDLGEDNKYKIERSFMIGATEEEISLLIAKLCRRGIKDYAIFAEYDAMMKEKYRVGELKYPIFSEYFEIEEIRKGGEYDEF